MRPQTQAIEHAGEKAEPMQANMRVAVGTLISAVICVFATAALWILPLALSNGGDPNASGWGVLAAMYSILAAGLAAALFLVSGIYFVIALSAGRPR